MMSTNCNGHKCHFPPRESGSGARVSTGNNPKKSEREVPVVK